MSETEKKKRGQSYQMLDMRRGSLQQQLNKGERAEDSVQLK